MGYYAKEGFSSPSSFGGSRYEIIYVTDDAFFRKRRSEFLNAVVAKVFPTPLRFKQVWHLARGTKPLYAWKPVAPEGYCALGMVCTTSEAPPNVDVMRCVPSHWCIVTQFLPMKIWDDSGAGGGKPGSIWVVNPHGLIAFVAGHDAPRDTFHELKYSTLPLDELDFQR